MAPFCGRYKILDSIKQTSLAASGRTAKDLKPFNQAEC